MRKMKLYLSALTAASMLLAMPMAASAMPADIEEAVSSGSYNAYEHVGGDSYYSSNDLISIGANYYATAGAMIRQSPFGTILGSTVPGQKYYVEGECSDCMWYKVSTGGVTGYVYACYLMPEYEYVHQYGNSGSGSSGSSSGSTGQTVQNVRSLDMMMTVTGASAVNVRTAPSSSGSIIGAASNGEEIHVTGNVLNTQWYRCKYKGQTAYICDDYLTPEFPQTLACATSVLNVRSSADSSAPVIGVLYYGDKVKASSSENDWVRFTMADGSIGYAFDEYLSVI